MNKTTKSYYMAESLSRQDEVYSIHSHWLLERASHLGFPVLVLQENVCFLAMILN